MNVLALLLLSVVPHTDETVFHVARLEINHFFTPEGKLQFSQLIWYDGPFAADVRDWRMLRSSTKPYNYSIARNFLNNSYRVSWMQDGQPLTVISQTFTESWTQYDPELLAREYVPQEHRVRFSHPPRILADGVQPNAR